MGGNSRPILQYWWLINGVERCTLAQPQGKRSRLRIQPISSSFPMGWQVSLCYPVQSSLWRMNPLLGSKNTPSYLTKKLAERNFEEKYFTTNTSEERRRKKLSNFAKLKLKLNYSICKEKGKFEKVLLCELFRTSLLPFSLFSIISVWARETFCVDK